MFTFRCDCKKDIAADATRLNHPFACPECGREIVCVSAEAMDDLAAGGDFDAGFLVVAGPVREAQVIALGGCATLDIGSDPGCPIPLAGQGVAAAHARVVRIDFGPSRWQIEKLSDAPLIVSGHEVAAAELQHGEIIEIGEFELRYQQAPISEGVIDDDLDEVQVAPQPGTALRASSVNARKATAPPRVETNGPLCPSCERRLGHHAKICVECGIRVPSGRPLMTSDGLDENIVHGNAETAIRVASWLVWITPLPIPLASSAYGKFKPFAIWSIAAITILASLWFFVAQWNNPQAMQSLMLWPLRGDDVRSVDQKVREWERMPHDLDYTRHTSDGLYHQPTAAEYREQLMAERRERQFHPYQLVTCALLHDPSSVTGFILHLGGNILFLIVFGSRVNAILGNVATAILYPLLAAASALAYLLTSPAGSLAPLVGASGAINGLAGMYLVLFPAHYVYCAVWCRVWGLRWNYFAMKVFALRGFWILLIYFAFDVLMVAMNSQGNTAHWAHIGGFVAGFLMGIAMLMSRLFDCRNGDLLSVVLGKHAWPLIGRPNRSVANVGQA
jgi:membrane associated rhomboid family serine protease